MAKTYDEFIKYVLPSCPGATDLMIERAAKEAVIELCQDAKPLRRELDAVTLVKNCYEYELDAPAHHSIVSIEYMSYEGKNLDPVTLKLLEQRTGDWRTDTAKEPKFYFRYKSDTVWLVPVPSQNQANAVRVGVVLKPSRNSTTFDDELFEDFFDAILNNILHRLYRIPGKDWSDDRKAAEYYALYEKDVDRIRAEARRITGGVTPVVEYGGIHSGRGYGRNTNDW